ncbi:MAG: hypothetical protein ABI143_06205, partial [Caldimonas sp.]
MSPKPLIAATFAFALVGPASAQTAKDFDELRFEIKRLRAEVDELKKSQAKPVAVAAPVAGSQVAPLTNLAAVPAAAPDEVVQPIALPSQQ